MITANLLLRQLKRDLIGKDSHRGTTQTYTLLANQFGHFALGFIPTIVIYLICERTDHPACHSWYPWLGVAAAWLLFEIFNFWKSVMQQARQKKRPAAHRPPPFRFRAGFASARFDTFTDVGFFSTGAACAACFFLPGTPMRITALALLLVFGCIFFHWYIVKMYVQEAMFPFHYRLGQWKNCISRKNAATALQFVTQKTTGVHLLVFGEKAHEKASLCIGIATEMAFKKQRCLYITSTKFFDLLQDNCTDSNPSLDIESSWSWQQAAVLIIDDINPSHRKGKKLHNAYQFCRSLAYTTNRQLLRSKNIIWVLGHDNAAHDQYRQWKKNLEKQIGVPAENIAAIHL